MINFSQNRIVRFTASHLWLLVILLQLLFFIQIGIIWRFNNQLAERERVQKETFVQEKVITPGMIRGL